MPKITTIHALQHGQKLPGLKSGFTPSPSWEAVTRLRWPTVNGWTPLAEPHICKNLLQISPRANSQCQIRNVCWNMGTYLLRTQRISNFLSSLPFNAFQCAVYAINVSITNALPPESRETPVQHKLFKCNMTYGKIDPHSPIAAPVWFSSTHDLA